jgi:hypothetical protein
MISDDIDIASALSKINFTKEKSVFEALVRSFDLKNSAVHFLKVLTLRILTLRVLKVLRVLTLRVKGINIKDINIY